MARFLALAGAALVAALAGGLLLVLALLLLAPLAGLLLLALDFAWVIGLPLSWWLTRGKAREPSAEERRRQMEANLWTIGPGPDPFLGPPGTPITPDDLDP